MDAALVGVIFRITIRKTSRGPVLLKGIEYVPTWVCIAKEDKALRCRVLPIEHALRKPESFYASQLHRMKQAYFRTLRMYKNISPLPDE
jgi:poly-gamma-glutamate synthesis protein (capsule biosynthesis protein)